MLDSGLIDAVLIATPHFSHPDIAVAAFERGLHVLTEKPAGVYAPLQAMFIIAAENYLSLCRLTGHTPAWEDLLQQIDRLRQACQQLWHGWSAIPVYLLHRYGEYLIGC